MSEQLSLFGPAEPVERCATCGATRPAGYTRMWLEPVSGECLECNHKTLREMYYGPDREAATRRHLRSLNPKTVDRTVRRRLGGGRR